MVVTETIAGLGAIKTAFDMTKALKEISDAAIRNGAIIELQEKILSAQEAQFLLVKRVDELEKEIASLKTKSNQFTRYKLRDYGAGTFAYELKAEEANGEPIHRACASCYQQDHISILNFEFNTEGQDWYECRKCNTRQKFGTHHPRRYERNHSSDF